MSDLGARTFPDVVPLEEASLAALAHSVCIIDSQGDILWTNPAWHAFASENDAGDASREWRSYFEPIPQPLRGFYEDAFREALATSSVFEQDYECSSADTARHYRLRAVPFEGRVLLLEHSLVSSLSHPEDQAAELQEHYVDANGIVTQCAHCRRVWHPRAKAFHWVPAWVRRSHARTSHALCPSCGGFYYAARGRRRR